MKKNKILGIMAGMMLSCKDATKLISKQQDSHLSIMEWINLKMHLLICYLCRRYDKQIQLISEKLELHKYMDDESDHREKTHYSLSSEQQSRLEESIAKQSKDKL